MKSKNHKWLTVILAVLGVGLIVSSVFSVFLFQSDKKMAEEKAKDIVVKMKDLMPECYDCVPDGRVDLSMASLEIDGENFCAIIEIPQYKKVLPVRSEWSKGEVSKYPCRYLGSIYDASLIIGGSDNEGQFDFMKNITIGDEVFITDVEGQRYSYTVCDIGKTDDVSTEKLTELEADLLLFARNSYSFDYTVVYCKLN
ncbi:MAG: hypothetical protein IJF69_02490 [Clostridia bacterium]|nr:hypothetical protein [Clostridia bacterium]